MHARIARFPAALGALLVFWVAARGFGPLALAQTPIKRQMVIVCTPNSVKAGNGPAVPQKNPIAFALEQAGPGSTIRLEAGAYPNFGVGFADAKAWNARTSGGTKAQPILITSNGGATIEPRGSGDTIAISAALRPGHITFQNLKIVPGYRAGVIFYGGNPGNRYEGFRFLDCDIVGTWNHLGNSGAKSTWGLWAYGLADFEFRGVRGRAKVQNIRKEHGFYIQNPQGPVTIENVDAKFLGRTFCQFTARKSDGPPGRGAITVRNCRIDEVCLAATDNYKGGSALTFAGRLLGPILIESNEVKIGFAPGVRKLTLSGVPYGTGALMIWDGRDEPNGPVTLRENRFTAAPGCGDRPLVSIGGVGSLTFAGRNEFSSQGDNPTLSLDPAGPGGRLSNTPNGPVELDPKTVIAGAVEVRGRRASEAKLAELLAGAKDGAKDGVKDGVKDGAKDGE